MTAALSIVVGAVAYESHPAANVFPLLEGAEFDALCEDIRAHGLRDPIVRVWVEHDAAIGTRKPLILDGRNRLRACQRVGKQPEFKDYDGDDPVAFVLSANLHRRHLNESQRALIASRIATLPNGLRADRVPTPRGVGSVPTQAAAAKMLNVGQRTVQRARAVLESATPEVIHEIEIGKLTVNEAAKMAAEGLHSVPAKTAPEAERPAPSKGYVRKSKSTGARDRIQREAAEFDSQVAALVEQGLGVIEIAKELGVPTHRVGHAKTRLGITGRKESPLAKLVAYAQEFDDTWGLVLANPSAIERANTEQRQELLVYLEALLNSTRRLIKRLNQSE
jgi:hypothetical protein